MNINYYLILALFILLPSKGKAQDPRFAQFYAAPNQLNPALTVVYEGRMRFIANYRDQWSSVLNDVPFRTVAAHLDYRFNIIGRDYLAFGANALQDVAGTSNLKRIKGHLNLAYMKFLGGGSKRNYYLVAGAQAGVGQHSLDWNNLWFSEQYDAANEIIDFSLPSGEIENRRGRTFPDFSAGALWYMVSERSAFYLGGAMYHINTPNLSIFEGNIDRLKRRYVVHTGGTISLTNNLALLPGAAIFLQGPSTDINIGANIRYTSGDQNDLALRIGTWAHISSEEEDNYALEALTMTAMLEMKTWTLGLSYDINTSELTPVSNARGAFETSFTYIIPERGRRVKVTCPKF